MTIALEDTEATFRHCSTTDLLRAKFLFQVVVPTLIVAKKDGRTRGERLAKIVLSVPLVGERLIRHVGPFPHFCGGVDIDACMSRSAKLARRGVRSIPDFSAEGVADEQGFDDARNEIIRVIQRSANNVNTPFAVFKVTALGRKALLEKASAHPLSAAEQTEFSRVVQRIEHLCEAACAGKLRVLIDAEETWIQDAIDDIALQMMRKFNKDQAVVYNTLQMYRTDRLAYLRQVYQQGRDEFFIPGIKLVRGAYMEAERERAILNKHASPIHETKEATDIAYNAALTFCLVHIDELALFMGTHNVVSADLLAVQMAERGINPGDPRVECSQLFGMGDNLSYILADEGFNTSKYVPYGPVREAIPYLIRRARENSSLTGQANRELALINRELSRRWPTVAALWKRVWRVSHT